MIISSRNIESIKKVLIDRNIPYFQESTYCIDILEKDLHSIGDNLTDRDVLSDLDVIYSISKLKTEDDSSRKKNILDKLIVIYKRAIAIEVECILKSGNIDDFKIETRIYCTDGDSMTTFSLTIPKSVARASGLENMYTVSEEFMKKITEGMGCECVEVKFDTLYSFSGTFKISNSLSFDGKNPNVMVVRKTVISPDSNSLTLFKADEGIDVSIIKNTDDVFSAITKNFSSYFENKKVNITKISDDEFLIKF